MLTPTAVGLALPMLLIVGVPAQDPPECVVQNSYGRCLVEAIDEGGPGTDDPVGLDDSPNRSSRTEEGANDDQSASPAPRQPSRVYLPFGDDGWAPTPQSEVDALLAELPAEVAPGPAAAAVSPEVLAARAIALLTLEPPVLSTSVAGTGFVGLPVWLWIDSGPAATGPVSATATAGAAQVTATGRLSAVEWSMGPPGELVRCIGPGTPWTGQEGPSPDCGYVYAQRSLPERTGSSGAWTITATAVWTVTWSGNSGGVPVVGQQTVLVPASTTLPVAEVQVLVGGTR